MTKGDFSAATEAVLIPIVFARHVLKYGDG
jgi:hypothetical protein